jgi:hypothetical protein
MTEDEMDEFIGRMFPEDDPKPGSPPWKRMLFERAYVEKKGPFDEVLRRLGNGFSVLAYLPGNCMAAAAETVHATVKSVTWKDYLRREKAAQSLEDVWRGVSQIVEVNERGGGGAIFHDLDFLTDSRGNVYPSLAAQTAAFGLVEGSRHGVVFGMSDREEPDLPSAIARAFSDRIRVEEIPPANFHRIVPRQVGEQLRAQLTELRVHLRLDRREAGLGMPRPPLPQPQEHLLKALL